MSLCTFYLQQQMTLQTNFYFTHVTYKNMYIYVYCLCTISFFAINLIFLQRSAFDSFFSFHENLFFCKELHCTIIPLATFFFAKESFDFLPHRTPPHLHWSIHRHTDIKIHLLIYIPAIYQKLSIRLENQDKVLLFGRSNPTES